MKVTNYANSRRLAEIGFKKNSIIGFFKSKCGVGGKFYISDGFKEGYDLEFPAFDLETILEALPDLIFGENKYKENYRLTYNSALGFFYPNLEKSFCKKENESLADCAARLLIMLFEKKLIEVK